MKIENENGYILYSNDDMDENVIDIDLVEVKQKRKGTGSKLVNQVIEIAKKEGKNISLCAYPQNDSITLSDLIKFYERLGFKLEYDDGNEAILNYNI